MAHDVFICYSGKNKTSADAVCATLESHGIRCWIAPRDVVAGMEWGECLVEAIEQSRILVLVFSADADASPQIRREVERAVNLGLAILPIRVEDVAPSKALQYFIGNVHWLDALTPPLEAHLAHLADTIDILLSRLHNGPRLNRRSTDRRSTDLGHSDRLQPTLQAQTGIGIESEADLPPLRGETNGNRLPEIEREDRTGARARHEDASFAAASANGALRPTERLIHRRVFGLSAMWMAILSLCAIAAVSALTYACLTRNTPPLHIASYRRITNDGRLKGPAGTDGTRLYFSEVSSGSIKQIGVTGGAVAPVPINLPEPRIWLLDISPDGSNALVGSSDVGRSVNLLWNVRILGGLVRRIGEGDSAAFTPDGNSIIYTTSVGDIYLSQADGTGKRKLAATGPVTSHIRMSPDGKNIRFDRNGVLWEMKSDGSNLHQLFSNWQESGSQCCGHWSTDGQFYFFLLAGSPSAGIQIWARKEDRGPFHIRSAWPFQLTFGPSRWGPIVPAKDGKNIYSVGQTLRGELARFDPKTRQLQPFLGGISGEFVSFSKDRQFAVYVSYPEGVLWRVNRDGGNPVQLTDTGSLYPINPRWSPDSKQIVFSADSGGRMTMFTIAADGGAAQMVIPQDEENQNDPNWSPDGQQIVFAGSDSKDPQKTSIRILNVSSKQIVTISGSVNFWSPRWSPDGRYIACLAREKTDLMVYDLKTNHWSTLALGSYAQFPEFSSDGKTIYFMLVGREQGVYRIQVTGGPLQQVVDLHEAHLTGLYNFSMSLDSSDAPLVLQDNNINDIYALALE